MAEHALKGLKVAILVTDGFEKIELTEPRKALDEAGAETRIVSPKVDRVPIGTRTQGSMCSSRKPSRKTSIQTHFVARSSHCHGPWTVIEAGAARGRRMTSWPSLMTDLKNAGADWVDQEVVVDQRLVTSRSPHDIPAFNREMRNLFSTARGRQQAA